MIFGDSRKMPKIQLGIIIIIIAYFSVLGMGFSAAYGGMISLINTALINRHTNKQNQALTMNANTSVGMMMVSVIMRMAMVAGLTLLGFYLLKLSADALTAGLVFGLIGFLIDRVKQG